jgi:hypothetical protein
VRSDGRQLPATVGVELGQTKFGEAVQFGADVSNGSFSVIRCRR